MGRSHSRKINQTYFSTSFNYSFDQNKHQQPHVLNNSESFLSQLLCQTKPQCHKGEKQLAGFLNPVPTILFNFATIIKASYPWETEGYTLVRQHSPATPFQLFLAVYLHSAWG